MRNLGSAVIWLIICLYASTINRAIHYNLAESEKLQGMTSKSAIRSYIQDPPPPLDGLMRHHVGSIPHVLATWLFGHFP